MSEEEEFNLDCAAVRLLPSDKTKVSDIELAWLVHQFGFWCLHKLGSVFVDQGI